MKTLFFKSIFALLIGSFLVLSSCAKKSNSTNSRSGTAVRGNDIANNNGVSNLGVARCSDGSSGWGRIYDDGSMYGTAFRDSFANFLSSVMDPQNLGNLDGAASSTTTGVNMELKLKVVNNQLNLSETRITMEINDSLVGTQGSDGEILKIITARFSSADSGQLTNVAGNSGNFQLVFKDSYGTVTVDGSFNGTEAKGRVNFSNSTNFNINKGETPKSGSLGAFYMKSCGLFY